jgi:transposase
MAGKTKTMSVVKQILLQHYQGRSKKSIVRDLGVSKNTVRRYMQLAQGSGCSIEDLLKMDDKSLESILCREVIVERSHADSLYELFPWIREELRRTGVNRWVLWGEYRQRYPEGYSYSQFCWHYQQWLQQQNVSMIMPHEPGDKVYIDFAGKKLRYHDHETEQDVEVEFFAGILGYSQLSFACVVPSQNTEDFLHGCRKMLDYIGGCPKAIVPDNLKSGVTRASRYEPEVSQSFSDFCNHYGMAVLPTRVAKPKDKPLVEGLVRILYSRIYAPLRDRTFYSLNEINYAIAELLEVHNLMSFTNKTGSRRKLFDEQEKALLLPLPDNAFEVKHYRIVTVQKISHVCLSEDKHYYSVPMRYIGKKVNLIYSSADVSVFCDGQQIAFHKRNRKPHGYTTNPDHVPSQHQYMYGLKPEQFIDWGKSIHDDVAKYVTLLIKSKKHPEQAYKSCQGIQSLTRKESKEKLIAACQQGLELKVYNYMFIKRVMENNQNTKINYMPTLPFHENIRGPQAYI